MSYEKLLMAVDIERFRQQLLDDQNAVNITGLRQLVYKFPQS
jgi:hypothetical protein